MSNYYEDSIKKSIPLIRWGIVTNNIDNGQSGIIQVRIDGIDDTVKIDSELPPCLPLLPRFLNVLPKVGDHFTANKNKQLEDGARVKAINNWDRLSVVGGETDYQKYINSEDPGLIIQFPPHHAEHAIV